LMPRARNAWMERRTSATRRYPRNATIDLSRSAGGDRLGRFKKKFWRGGKNRSPQGNPRQGKRTRAREGGAVLLSVHESGITWGKTMQRKKTVMDRRSHVQQEWKPKRGLEAFTNHPSAERLGNREPVGGRERGLENVGPSGITIREREEKILCQPPAESARSKEEN